MPPMPSALHFQLNKALHLGALDPANPLSPSPPPPPRRSPHRISCLGMAAAPLPPPPTVRTVSIPYAHLKDGGRDLSGLIEEGFGPRGLGIISVSDVPGFALLRKNLLYLAPRLANLSEDEKRELEDPDSRYSFGWSHGKEMLESGKPGSWEYKFC